MTGLVNRNGVKDFNEKLYKVKVVFTNDGSKYWQVLNGVIISNGITNL